MFLPSSFDRDGYKPQTRESARVVPSDAVEGWKETPETLPLRDDFEL
jgi:hypothetical protein